MNELTCPCCPWTGSEEEAIYIDLSDSGFMLDSYCDEPGALYECPQCGEICREEV